jgi:hypothetical protein
VTDTESRMTMRLGQVDESDRLAGIVSDIAEKVLQVRPGDLRAMKNQYFSLNMQANVARNRHDLAKALLYNTRADDACRYYTRFNPADAGGWDNRGQGNRELAASYIDLGRITEGLETLQEGAAMARDPRNKTGMSFFSYQSWVNITIWNAQLGNLGSARSALEQSQRTLKEFVKDHSIDAELEEIGKLDQGLLESAVDQAEGKYEKVHARALETADRLSRMKLTAEGNVEFRANALRRSRNLQVESALRLGNFEEAITAARDLLDKPLLSRRIDALEKDTSMAQSKVRYGQALLGAGRRLEALAVLRDAEGFFREQQARGAADTGFRLQFARSLFQLARAQADDEAGRSQRLTLLDEAMTQLGGLTVEARQLRDSRELLKWVTDARSEARSGA